MGANCRYFIVVCDLFDGILAQSPGKNYGWKLLAGDRQIVNPLAQPLSLDGRSPLTRDAREARTANPFTRNRSPTSAPRGTPLSVKVACTLQSTDSMVPLNVWSALSGINDGSILGYSVRYNRTAPTATPSRRNACPGRNSANY
jgi:hypothetical protein